MNTYNSFNELAAANMSDVCPNVAFTCNSEMSEQFKAEADKLYAEALAAVPAAAQMVEKMKEKYKQVGLPTQDTRKLGKILHAIHNRKARNRTQKSIAEEFGIPPAVVKQAAKIIDADAQAQYAVHSVPFNERVYEQDDLEHERVKTALSKPLQALMEMRWSQKYENADPETTQVAQEYSRKVHALIDRLDMSDYDVS